MYDAAGDTLKGLGTFYRTLGGAPVLIGVLIPRATDSWVAKNNVCDAAAAIENLLLNTFGLDPWGILILMLLSFIVMGMFLDDTAMLVIVAPPGHHLVRANQDPRRRVQSQQIVAAVRHPFQIHAQLAGRRQKP